MTDNEFVSSLKANMPLHNKEFLHRMRFPKGDIWIESQICLNFHLNKSFIFKKK